MAIANIAAGCGSSTGELASHVALPMAPSPARMPMSSSSTVPPPGQPPTVGEDGFIPSNDQIAGLLGISYWTVRSHLRKVFTKFDVANRVEQTRVLMAARQGWPQAHACGRRVASG